MRFWKEDAKLKAGAMLAISSLEWPSITNRIWILKGSGIYELRVTLGL